MDDRQSDARNKISTINNLFNASIYRSFGVVTNGANKKNNTATVELSATVKYDSFISLCDRAISEKLTIVEFVEQLIDLADKN